MDRTWLLIAERLPDVQARLLSPLRLAGALPFFWTLRGESAEGLDWLEGALA